MLEAQHALLRMDHLLLAAGDVADVVGLPPAGEIRTVATQPVEQVDEGGVACHRSCVMRNIATIRLASSAQLLPNRRRLAGLVSMEINVLRSSSAMRPKAKTSSAALFQASTSQRRPVTYAG